MAVQIVKPSSNAQRHLSYVVTKGLSRTEPEKSLISILPKNSGRNNTGRITVRHQGGREKRYYRKIDFKRNKVNIPAEVMSFEYDPNRTSHIALLKYADGEKRYIIAPDGLKIGDTVIASDTADFKPGNTLPLAKVPLGMPIHNIELRSGKGGQIVRSAGSSALIQSREGNYANVLLPSGEVRKIALDCHATIGQISNTEWKNISLGKAGRKRHMGIRPTVRGVAMAPNAHPHGGGEGRSSVGMANSKSKWGKPTRGIKTRRKKKYSNKLIVSKRKK